MTNESKCERVIWYWAQLEYSNAFHADAEALLREAGFQVRRLNSEQETEYYENKELHATATPGSLYIRDKPGRGARRRAILDLAAPRATLLRELENIGDDHYGPASDDGTFVTPDDGWSF